jgi:hypothetical protein
MKKEFPDFFLRASVPDSYRGLWQKKLAKKFFLLTAFLCSISSLYAQDPMVYVYRPHWPAEKNNFHSSLAFSGEYTVGSDGLTNSFVNSFYKGDFFDSTTKANQENMLHPVNSLGAYAAYSMSYSWRNNPDSTRWEFTVAYRDRQTLFGTFSADAFKLGFEGNRAFLGKSAVLDKTQLTEMHWQQMQFEGKYYSEDNRSEVALGFSVLNGQQLQEVNIRKGSVYTEASGNYVDVNNFFASYYRSDTASTKYGSRNGTGTSFNFRFSTLLGDSLGKFKHQISFMIQDFGYIRWNNKSQIYDADTSIHYAGVDASNVVLNGGTVTGVPNSDSLIGKPHNGDIISFLPLGLRFRYSLLTPLPVWGGVDVRSWSYAGANPQITLFAGWHNKNYHLSMMGGVAYGGFGRIQFPLQIGWESCKYFSLTAGTTNLGAYLAPSKTHGQGMYLNMSFGF